MVCETFPSDAGAEEKQGERSKGPLWWLQGVLAARVYLLVSLLLPCCYINIMNCSQVHQMRFRWSLGALLPKQAKLGGTDASGKLQSLSRSTKLELMKVGAHIWPWWPSQQWDAVPCLTLAGQGTVSALVCGRIDRMGQVSLVNWLPPKIIMERRVTAFKVESQCMLVQCFYCTPRLWS